MNLTDLIDFDMLDISAMVEKFKIRENFSFARYGDGEFAAILNDPLKVEKNCDGHKYYPEMGRKLGEILASDPPYFVGIHQDKKTQDATINWLIREGLMWMDDNGRPFWNNRPFAANAVFHDAVIGKKRANASVEYEETPGQYLDAFWNALECRNVLIVAPDYIKHQQKILHAEFLPIPGQETFLHVDSITERAIRKLGGIEDPVVLICASMTAPILVHRLWREYGDLGTFIDFGSTFDPFVGMPSRSFHSKAFLHESIAPFAKQKKMDVRILPPETK